MDRIFIGMQRLIMHVKKLNFLIRRTNDNYLHKFRIYCLINENNIPEAQLQYDLLG